MKLQVVKAGPMTSLQDMGRTGYQKSGVLVNGAMDTWSLRLANLLVGNAQGEAALEMTLQGPELILPAGLIFALTGADMSPSLDGVPVPEGRPILVLQESHLRFGICRRGCRGYMAVSGGFDVPVVMGSKSTYLRANIGGFEGRALQAGDRLPVGSPSALLQKLTAHLPSRASQKVFAAVSWFIPEDFLFDASPVRATKGLQYDWFTEESCQAFFSKPFLVTMQSDRMGYRLQGEKLALREPREMISEPIAFGAVQVADGNPILLLADRQTTGGYPKIAQVVLADLARIGQRIFDTQIQFSLVSLKEAEALYLKQEACLQELAAAIRQRMEQEIGKIAFQ